MNSEGKLSIAVLVSGNGSNLQTLIDQQQSGQLPVDIRVVICNKPEAYAITRAQQAQIPVHVIEHQHFDSREAFDAAMSEVLKEYHIQLIVLAGFMRLLSPSFIQQWPQQIINLHPSLLPAFPGLHAIEQAWEYGVKITGCSVFFVDEGVDTGKILLQEAVTVEDHDTLESLEQKVHAAEHRVLPAALKKLAHSA